MLGSYNLIAFVMTADADRAKAFYADTLGLKFVRQDAFALVFDANGIILRVSFMQGFTPSGHAVLGWIVPDIAETAAEMMKAGVKFEKYSFMEQDELGIWSEPGGTARVAWFKDPDGNILSISQL